MAIKLPLAFKMGLAQNIERDRIAESDRKERIQALNDKKREWLFTSFMTDSAARKKSAGSRFSLIKQAVTDGFSKEAAMLLESSGELADHVKRIDKLKLDGEYNLETVKRMSQLVLDTLADRPEEEQIAAQKYIMQGNLNYKSESEFEDEFINAIFSADPNSLGKATKLYSNVMAGGGGGGLDFSPTGLSTRGLKTYGPAQRASVNKLIASNVAGYLGKNAIVTFDGGTTSWKGPDAVAAQDLTRRMNEVAEEIYYNSTKGGDILSVVGVMSANLSRQAKVDGLKVKDYVISTEAPDVFVPPVPTGETEEEDGTAGGPESVTVPNAIDNDENYPPNY